MKLFILKYNSMDEQLRLLIVAKNVAEAYKKVIHTEWTYTISTSTIEECKDNVILMSKESYYVD